MCMPNNPFPYFFVAKIMRRKKWVNNPFSKSDSETTRTA